jgi:hypothetical protein
MKNLHFSKKTYIAVPLDTSTSRGETSHTKLGLNPKGIAPLREIPLK